MRITDFKQPFAITMWDSSWLRRRYPGGGFESFDTALDELVERGYNAVRIDAFPHMIANAPDGTNSERFLDPTGVAHQRYGFAQWGSPWTVYSYPRRDILELLEKCEERGVYVILSTWLKPTIEPRHEWIEGPQDLVRVWDETLHFLEDNGRLNNVIAVDVQNEFPYGGCNMWLFRQMDRVNKDTATQTGTQRKVEFYRNYFNTVVKELKSRWPGMPISASSNSTFLGENKDMDYSEFDWQDVHLWSMDFFLWETRENLQEFKEMHDAYKAIASFGDPANLYTYQGNFYSTGMNRIPCDINFEKYNQVIQEQWLKNRSYIEEELEKQIATVAQTCKKYGVPYGCTEGWGTVCWAEHPLLTWDLIKDAAIIAARLGYKYGYTFNCQSNFCEPQFISLWRDVEHHREVTDIIKGVKQ